MKTNEHLKTSNEILKELNKIYFVCGLFVNTDKTKYMAYDMPDGGGMNHVFTMTVKPSSKKSVEFNRKRYTDVKILLADVEEYNKTLPFPAKLYDPNMRSSYIDEARIVWYLTEKLGLKANVDNVYEVCNMYNEPIMHFSVKPKHWYDEEEKPKDNIGMIIRTIGQGSWISMGYTSAEDAIMQINSLIASEATINAMKSIDLIKNLDGGFSSLDDAKISSWQAWLSGNENKYKNTLIPVLEKLLNTLKNE